MAKSSRVALGDWPRLTRFYGLSPFELARMPNWLTRLYAKKLPGLEAEELLSLYIAPVLPHVRVRDRDRMLRRIQERAGFEEVVETIDSQTEEGKVVLAGMGIGVVLEDSDV